VNCNGIARQAEAGIKHSSSNMFDDSSSCFDKHSSSTAARCMHDKCSTSYVIAIYTIEPAWRVLDE